MNDTAKLTFPNLDIAEAFGTEWSRFTFEGRDRSAVRIDGSVSVTVYKLFECCGLELGHADYKVVGARHRVCVIDNIEPSKAKPQFKRIGCLTTGLRYASSRQWK